MSGSEFGIATPGNIGEASSISDFFVGFKFCVSVGHWGVAQPRWCKPESKAKTGYFGAERAGAMD